MRPFYVRSGEYQGVVMAPSPKEAVLKSLDDLEDDMMNEGICAVLGEFIHCSETDYEGCEYDPDAYHYLTTNMLQVAGMGYLSQNIIDVEEQQKM
jgi:hypothetical protein